jgi:beta-galactosidase
MKRKMVFFLALLFFGFDSASSQNPYSSRISLGWEFSRGDLGGIWEAWRYEGKEQPNPVPAWEKVTVPHSFNADDAVNPGAHYYQGPAWYRTRVTINNSFQNGRTLLHFEGTGQKTDVYVYLTKIASHVGGYDEWTVDITEAVEQFKKNRLFQSVFNGTIPIAIRCDNSRDLEMIPSSLSDFTLFGGLYRYVNLVQVPALHIEKVLASSETGDKSDDALLNLSVGLNHPSGDPSAYVEVVLTDGKGKKIHESQGKIGTRKSISLQQKIRKISKWSPSNPVLYNLAVTLYSSSGTHKHLARIGFRHFEFKEQGPFHLNGSRLLLRGTHRHEDHATVGNAMTERQIREEMVMMKKMGANFIRLGHYQQSRIVLDLCDSLGLLVWEEIPWCRGGLGGETYKAQARGMLINMIEQHYNHPSVIIWGLGNENDWPGDFPEFDKERIRTFMKELNDIAHKLDPSRKTAIRRCDFCKDIVDVYSPSIWAGWYRGRYTEYKSESEKEYRKVKHYIHAEWGGDSHARRHAEDPEDILAHIKTGVGVDERSGDASLHGGDTRFSKDGDWSETYVCNLIDWHLKEQENMPWLTGTAYWPFKDFSTPGRPENPVPFVNQKGVVERDFTPKESYYVFQSYWGEVPMVHLYGHTWPTRWGNAGESKLVKVYSNCDEAELFVNGKSYGSKKRNSQDFPAAGLRWMVPMQEGSYHFRVVARKGRVVIEDEITQYYQTRRWTKPSQITLHKSADEDGLVTVEARLLDEKDVQCLDARNWIHFSLVGDGELVDNMGTSSASNKVQAYNGRAVISIQCGKGRNVVAVTSPGMQTVFLDLSGKNKTP